MSILGPGWTALFYLVAAVCFILALKGLSSPRTARRGNAIGAAGALVAVVTVFLSAKLENIPLILAAIAVGSAVAVPVARRVQMTQMPQLVALFNGVGGGAAALVAVLELGHSEDPWVRLAVVFTMLVGAVSFAGSAVTVGKLQELISTRPLLFPGMPVVMGAVVLGAVAAGGFVVAHGFNRLGRGAAGAGPRGGTPAGAARRRGRRADRDLPAQRLHRPRGRGLRHCAGQCAAAGRRHAGRGQRHHPDQGDGVRDGPRCRAASCSAPSGAARRRDQPCRATGRCAPPRPRTSPSSSAMRSGW